MAFQLPPLIKLFWLVITNTIDEPIIHRIGKLEDKAFDELDLAERGLYFKI